jgi:hypothetical protein
LFGNLIFLQFFSKNILTPLPKNATEVLTDEDDPTKLELQNSESEIWNWKQSKEIEWH